MVMTDIIVIRCTVNKVKLECNILFTIQSLLSNNSYNNSYGIDDNISCLRYDIIEILFRLGHHETEYHLMIVFNNCITSLLCNVM